MSSENIHQAAPKLASLLEVQLEVSPAQQTFFAKRFKALSESELFKLEELAGIIANLIEGREPRFAADYDWLCERMLEEELFFSRHRRYRLSTFKEAIEQVYSNSEYMGRYMNGLLMTQLWWSNHTNVISYYRDEYLSSNPADSSHLEIGPGHGLFLYFAASDPRVRQAEAWDVSAASVQLTRSNLSKLGLQEIPVLRVQDMFESQIDRTYDSIVLSEVLEHLQEPAEALAILKALLSPRGRIFINMPINSPAPDHLFNLDSPEDLLKFVGDAGFQILGHDVFPATNKSLEIARKKKFTINCAIIAGA